MIGQTSNFQELFHYFLCGAQRNHLAILISGRAIDMGKQHFTENKKDGTKREMVVGYSDDVVPPFQSMYLDNATGELRLEYRTAEDAIKAMPYFPSPSVRIGVCFNSSDPLAPYKSTQVKEFTRQEIIDI
ncbi:MAG: hypothetical protein LBK26_04625, partial [Rickettsiales bacterium]|nr:hypothetical protein [Rickettsiales bacterium]